MGPQVAERLYQHPEVIEALNKMPPAQARRHLDQLDGVLMAERQFAAQNGYTPQPRRISKAPPPMRTPAGGANPPHDLHQLATRSENISDYVRARQQQEKRRDG